MTDIKSMSDLIEEGAQERAAVSSRLHRILTIPSHNYGGRHMTAAQNLFSESNKSGNIPMAVAENRLLSEEMTGKVSTITDFPCHVLNYTNSCGLPFARETLAQFLRTRVFSLPIDCEIHPNQLTISAGCVALLYQLSYLLFEPTDSLLIPSPYYPAFDRDFLTIGEVVSIEVFKDEGMVSHGITTESLQRAYDLSLTRGKRPKGLLLSNPCNPSGAMYSAEELLTAVNFCRSHAMHLICDEVYALSVHGDVPFTSIVNVLHNNLGNDVHVTWSMSKDFGCSGIRMGVLYSQSEILNKGISATNDSFMCSNICQYIVASVLKDSIFVDSYIALLRSRLRESHEALVRALGEIRTVGSPNGITLAIRATAGIFVFVDLRSLLLIDTAEGEQELYDALYARGVVLTPGLDCHAAVPGYFRLCFAWVSKDVMLEGVRRIKEYAREIGVLVE